MDEVQKKTQYYKLTEFYLIPPIYALQYVNSDNSIYSKIVKELEENNKNITIVFYNTKKLLIHLCVIFGCVFISFPLLNGLSYEVGKELRERYHSVINNNRKMLIDVDSIRFFNNDTSSLLDLCLVKSEMIFICLNSREKGKEHIITKKLEELSFDYYEIKED